jgi:MFS superfamily sulfate permease-like transporter
MIAQAASPPSAVIIDASALDEIDYTTTEMFIEFVRQLRAKGIEVYVTDVHAPVLEGTDRAGLLEAMGGMSHIFPTVDAAVNHLQSEA